MCKPIGPYFRPEPLRAQSGHQLKVRGVDLWPSKFPLAMRFKKEVSFEILEYSDTLSTLRANGIDSRCFAILRKFRNFSPSKDEGF